MFQSDKRILICALATACGNPLVERAEASART